MEDDQGIYREEVLLMMGLIADIYRDTSQILDILDPREENDEESEEMDP